MKLVVEALTDPRQSLLTGGWSLGAHRLTIPGFIQVSRSILNTLVVKHGNSDYDLMYIKPVLIYEAVISVD